MSLALARQGENKTPKDFKDIIDYCTDPVKITNKDGKKYVFGFGCLTDDPLSEMKSVKKINGKTTGRQYIQIIFSPTPVYNNLKDEEYMELGKEIAKFYYDMRYQCVVVVHFDTDKRHIHLVINTVSYENGKKFSQPISVLNKFKLHCNRILTKYGLDIIRIPTEKIEDKRRYSFANGYDFLEAYDEILKDISISFSDDIDNVGMVNNTPSKKNYEPDAPKKGYNCFFAAQSETYRDYYIPREIPGFPKVDISNAWAPESELAPMAMFDTANILPVITIMDNFHESNITYESSDTATESGLHIKAGRTVDVYVPESVEPKDIPSIINRIPSQALKEKHDAVREATNARAALHNFGDGTQVTVDIQDHITAHYGSDTPDTIVDTVSSQDTEALHLPCQNIECTEDDTSAHVETPKRNHVFAFKALADYDDGSSSAPEPCITDTNNSIENDTAAPDEVSGQNNFKSESPSNVECSYSSEPYTCPTIPDGFRYADISIANDKPAPIVNNAPQSGFFYQQPAEFNGGLPFDPASCFTDTNYNGINDSSAQAGTHRGNREFAFRALANYKDKF